MRYLYYTIITIVTLMIYNICIGKDAAITHRDSASIDCIEIDSIVHSYHSVRCAYSSSVVDGKWQWGNSIERKIQVLISEQILVADNPAQLYVIVDIGQWVSTADGTMRCELMAIDQDECMCKVILDTMPDNKMMMYIIYNNSTEAYRYELV